MLPCSNAATELEAIAIAVPKCDLHTHLDGSLSGHFICTRAAARGIELPEGINADGTGMREYLHARKAIQIQHGHRAAPGGNWDVFDFCNSFLQTGDELTEATIDILDRYTKDNVWLSEIRFCPLLHCREGLSSRDAVLAVAEGFRLMRQRTGILGGVILCGLRSHSAEETLGVAKLACDMMEETGGIVLGFDIAGDEGSYPIHDHMESIRYANQHGAGVTAHAGEWPVNGTYGTTSLDNLKHLVSSGLVHRIGHGIQITKDAEYLNLFAKNEDYAKLCFECCLTANVGWKIPSYDVHPIKEMLRHGLCVTLNCDNTMLSGSVDRAATPSGEVVRFVRSVGLSYSDLKTVIMNSARSSFVFQAQRWSDTDKGAWLQKFEDELNSVLLTVL